MMKKICMGFLVLVLIIGLVGCGSTGGGDDDSSSDSGTTLNSFSDDSKEIVPEKNSSSKLSVSNEYSEELEECTDGVFGSSSATSVFNHISEMDEVINLINQHLSVTTSGDAVEYISDDSASYPITTMNETEKQNLKNMGLLQIVWVN